MTDWVCACEQENDEGDDECCACSAKRPTKPTQESKFQGYVVGLITTIEAIPKSPLRECKVDIGGGKSIKVVTAAKNVREGTRTVVAMVGATVEVDGETLVVKKTSVGGRSSEGMLCDSVMLGWQGGGAGTAVVVPDELPLGAAPPASKPRK